jgi:phospho-N-acetylmuramoyl-pentapeptide-transferase
VAGERVVIALLLAAGTSMACSLVLTRLLIRWLSARRVAQPIKPESERGPKGHGKKAGTPTMGGIAIVVSAVIGYLTAHLRRGAIFTYTGLIVMLAIIGAGVVGFLDDFIKVRNARNLGLRKGAKVLGLWSVAAAFALLMLLATDVHTELSFTRYDSIGLDLHGLGWGVWAVLLIVAASNAVNLTDGLDGLASGSASLSFAAYVVIAFWAFRHPGTYDVTHALDQAIVAAAMLGGCVGFLWWNAAPARIFMGDTGSLAIGTGLAALALGTNTHLLLPILGGLYVAITMSSMIQIASYRLFHRRVFRMAPLHHHFEMKGWPETTVMVRFWIVSGLLTAFALGLFYADFISTGAVD